MRCSSAAYRDRLAVTRTPERSQVRQYPYRCGIAVLGQAQLRAAGVVERRIGLVAGRQGEQRGQTRQRLHHITRVPLGIRQAGHAGSSVRSLMRLVLLAHMHTRTTADDWLAALAR
jgi:hypothetical protein